MSTTLGARDTPFKHLFERVSTLSVGGDRTRTRVRSNTSAIRPVEVPMSMIMTVTTGALGVRPIRGARRHRAAARPLRLTSRGRAVVRSGAVLLAAAAVIAVVLIGSRPARAGDPGASIPVRHHLVLPGETLWGIAREVAPRADPRDVVADIVELNELDGALVTPGQRLALPEG
jgi:hypothetical protein